MANWWDQFVTNLGTQNAPFGFASQAPSQGMLPEQQAQQAGYQMIGDVGANMLANASQNPLAAFGNAYRSAKDSARERNKEGAAAAVMMQQAEERRQQRAEQEQQKAKLKQWIASSNLTPEQKALAEHFPEQFASQFAKSQFPNADSAEYGLNPVWTLNPQTNQYELYQPSKAGGAPSRIQFPGGVVPQPPVSFQDLGTGVGTFSTRGGAQLGTTPKDLAGAEAQKEIGKSTGGAQFSLPQAKVKYDNAVKGINELINHPGLNSAVGTWQGTELGGAVGGFFNSDVAGFRSRVRQLAGGAFLQAYETLKGGGPIANAEGNKAEQAVARLNTAVSEADFKQALKDYLDAIDRGYAALQQQAGQGAAGGEGVSLKDKYGLE